MSQLILFRKFITFGCIGCIMNITCFNSHLFLRALFLDGGVSIDTIDLDSLKFLLG